jgi:predicted Zn-dependent protease
VADDPEDYFTRFGLGQALVQAGRTGEAITHLQASLRLNPDYPVAHRYLGTALEAEGRPDEALRIWDEGVRVAERLDLIQTAREIQVFAARLRKKV